MRVGLLVVGHVDPKSVDIAGDYPELFDDLLAPHGVELVTYAADAGQLPATVDECDGWLCSPSRSSVYDREAWIEPVEQFVHAVVDAERPYVGICFGHQLLARALGAEVARSAGGWQVGVQTYALTRRTAWMEPALASLSLIASHQDQVVSLPAGAELLARGVTGESAVAGFTVGDHAWTLQAHPEFVPTLADHLLAGRVELIGADRVTAARATLGAALDRLTVARWIGTFFAMRAG